MFYSWNQISINKAVQQAMFKAAFGKLMNKTTFAKILEYLFLYSGIKILLQKREILSYKIDVKCFGH
jgi:hypothetical protein